MIWKSLQSLLGLQESEPVGTAMGEVTALLAKWRCGNDAAQERLLQLVYPELKRIAGARMRRERSNHTLQPTALVHEVFLRLVGQQQITWQSRAHFLAVASEAMRRILVDYARGRWTAKRGGGARMADLDVNQGKLDRAFDVIEIDEILTRLALENARLAKLVELRFFGGLSHEEVAEVLGISSRTAKRDWEVARAWLYAQLKKAKAAPHARGLESDQSAI